MAQNTKHRSGAQINNKKKDDMIHEIMQLY